MCCWPCLPRRRHFPQTWFWALLALTFTSVGVLLCRLLLSLEVALKVGNPSIGWR